MWSSPHKDTGRMCLRAKTEGFWWRMHLAFIIFVIGVAEWGRLMHQLYYCIPESFFGRFGRWWGVGRVEKKKVNFQTGSGQQTFADCSSPLEMKIKTRKLGRANITVPLCIFIRTNAAKCNIFTINVCEKKVYKMMRCFSLVDPRRIISFKKTPSLFCQDLGFFFFAVGQKRWAKNVLSCRDSFYFRP